MRIGFHLTPFWSPADRNPTQIIDEAIQVVAIASKMGFAWVSIGHHWMSYPTVWPQPFPILARLAPKTGRMRLKTSMVLLPLLNPVDAAENIATLNQITHGRFDVGVANGYRELELEAAGLTRKDRAPKMEESLEIMKRLWRGEQVTFEGAHTRVSSGRMGFTPFQKPYPPLEMAAQSVRAAERAARLTDGVFFGPQITWADVVRLGQIFREARRDSGHATPGRDRVHDLQPAARGPGPHRLPPVNRRGNPPSRRCHRPVIPSPSFPPAERKEGQVLQPHIVGIQDQTSSDCTTPSDYPNTPRADILIHCWIGSVWGNQ